MSEEEIIKNIKEQIQWSDHNTYKMALQGLLDLYQKEKEKDRRIKDELKKIVDLYDNTLQCTRKYNDELANILCDLQELLEERN